MFIIRTAFWLALVIAFIPVRQSDLQEGVRPVSPLETVGLATAVASDLGRFCERNTATCATGGALFSQMGIKAREGARLAYQWFDDGTGGTETAAVSPDPVQTGSLAN